ncbi:Cytoplasmic tRNA 2-thiolation protein 2 [Friedmanniomyces endolithicus]|nr:Cytoplasmic tRNA 2-thiolation protein 2 [Friedmanniomyces endolithicus]
MAGPPKTRRDNVAVDNSLCRRCQTNAPTVTVRTEPLCSPCFNKYVSTKIIKRMESFRVRHAEAGHERLLLLPLSLRACSVVLLHILSQHLRVQGEKSGRTGYRLHVLYVQDGKGDASVASDLFEMVQHRYPEHIYSTCPLSDALALPGMQELLAPNQPAPQDTTATPSPPDLSTILTNLTSATSRTDLHHLLLRKLLVHSAQHHTCSAILWASSTTRLAERTLAETAKGRAFALPAQTRDGETPLGTGTPGTPFYYPMRDLLRKEILSYTSLVSPDLEELILEERPRPAVSTRDTSIDELMKQYFLSVEREYPSIVANVVRTTGKLMVQRVEDGVEGRCGRRVGEMCVERWVAGFRSTRDRLWITKDFLDPVGSNAAHLTARLRVYFRRGCAKQTNQLRSNYHPEPASSLVST